MPNSETYRTLDLFRDQLIKRPCVDKTVLELGT